MVLKPEPMVAAIRAAKAKLPAARVIAMCPGGRTLRQSIVEEYAHSKQDLILVCGHYEGFDERIFGWVDEKLSIGDYVLTGGELPALIVMDAVARFHYPACWGKWPALSKTPSAPGCLNTHSTHAPSPLKALKCPKCCVMATMPLSIRWRRKEALKATWLRRPDLLGELNKTDAKLLAEIKQELEGAENG